MSSRSQKAGQYQSQSCPKERGVSEVLEGKRLWSQALESINRAIVSYPKYLPALIEKAKTHMMTAE